MQSFQGMALHYESFRQEGSSKCPHQYWHGKHSEGACEGSPRGCGILQTDGLSGVSTCAMPEHAHALALSGWPLGGTFVIQQYCSANRVVSMPCNHHNAAVLVAWH